MTTLRIDFSPTQKPARILSWIMLGLLVIANVFLLIHILSLREQTSTLLAQTDASYQDVLRQQAQLKANINAYQGVAADPAFNFPWSSLLVKQGQYPHDKIQLNELEINAHELNQPMIVKGDALTVLDIEDYRHWLMSQAELRQVQMTSLAHDSDHNFQFEIQMKVEPHFGQ
jgi:hypothetical protein